VTGEMGFEGHDFEIFTQSGKRNKNEVIMG
jgi:hypothetical protein